MYQTDVKWRSAFIAMICLGLTGCFKPGLNNPHDSSSAASGAGSGSTGGPTFSLPGYGTSAGGSQAGAVLTPSSCSTQSSRPCLQGRVAVGAPLQYDKNTSANPAYATVAGAGKTQVTSGNPDRAPNFPRVENLQMSIMKQTSGQGNQSF